MIKDILLEADGLCAGYNDKIIISDIGFHLSEGMILTLIGPNGSGKTTLLRVLGGLKDAAGGRVLVDGLDIKKHKASNLSKKMAMLFTDRVRVKNMSCFEMVSMGRHPYTGAFGVLRDEDKRIISDAMEKVGMREYSDMDFSSCSDGERQLVLLARAIAQQPRLLLLDEPASYLDISHKLSFIDIVKRLADEEKMGIVMSVHEPELAWRAADEVLCLGADGRIAGLGKPKEVLTDKSLSELFGVSAGKISELYRGFSDSLISG